MMAGKSQASAKPTAMGTLLQAATYGQTIPTIYGTTRTAPLAIWAANLRQGHCIGKKYKFFKKKKSPPQYIENIDFLVGSNPIDGVLQTWNNTTKFPLNFTKYRTNFTGSPTITVPDAQLYWVLAVTFELTLTGTFNDFGGPGPVPYSVTPSEIAGYNIFNQGPDLVDAWGAKASPWLYKWAVGDGNVVTFPGPDSLAFLTPLGSALWNGFINIYYAQKSSVISHHTPLAKLCLTFEPVLGDGPEYTGDFQGTSTPLSTQQILYPEYAGVGSPDIDLGSSTAIPSIGLETRGSFARIPPYGDADFCDMIEDTIKSGMIQAGAQLGLIQRGVNLNDLPGPIQKNFQQYIDPAIPNPTYWQPSQAGNQLLVIASFRYDAGDPTGTPTISDVAGDTWVPLFGGNDMGVFAATSVGWTLPNTVTVEDEHGGSNFSADAFILEMDPGSTVLDNFKVFRGTTPGGPNTMISGSIAVTGAPNYVLAILLTDEDELVTPPIGWTNIFPMAFGSAPPFKTMPCARTVAKPGPVTFKYSMAGGVNWTLVLVSYKSAQPVPYPKALGNIIDLPSLNLVRQQCMAGGLWGSVTMNSQQTAADWLADFGRCADLYYVWSGFTLKFIPRSEVSAVGNGTVYIAPTANGPSAILPESHLVGTGNDPLVVVERKAQVDANNIAQIQYYDRFADYNPSSASEPYQAAVALQGPRKESPINLPEVQDPIVARALLAIEVRRYNLLRNEISFTMCARDLLREAGDLIEVNDSEMGITNMPVRLISVVETDDFTLECKAEPFIYGCNAPQALPVTSLAPFNPNDTLGGDPGQVNTPIIFEPVPRLTAQQNQAQLWAVVSGANPNYGGCVVLLSTDGGVSYNTVGVINGNATTGVTTADWPIATDPDTTNDLPVDLTESLGTLLSYQVADEDNFVYPCYIDHGITCIPYGLMTYAVATLTAPNKYTLKATGGGTNHLRRCVFSAPQPATDVDHPSGSRWAFLNPSGVGIFKINMDPLWAGKTLMFKFLAFNSFGNNMEDQSAATAYSYAPTLCPSAPQNPNNFTYYITGGALTNPTSTTIHMAQATGHLPSNTTNYNARTFTIPAPSVPTRYYVTILDPDYVGDTGTMTNLTATCQTSNALVGAPGQIYIGSIIAMPAGGGTITSQGGLPAGPIPNFFIVTGLVAGNNTVPHSLGFSPSAAIIQMNSAAEIWWQATPWDGTNFYLVASDASATCFIIYWGVSP